MTVILANSNYTNAGVRDCTVDGNNFLASVGVHFQGATDCIADRVVAKNLSSHCLYMSRAASRNVWQDCTGDNGKLSSLMIYDSAVTGSPPPNLPNVDNLVLNCVGDNSGTYQGLEIRHSHRNRVIACRFHNNAANGLLLEEGAEENVIVGCHMYSNGSRGVMFDGTDGPATDNAVEACVIEDNSGVGIYILKAPRNLFSGCHILRNSAGVDVRWEPPNVSLRNRFANCRISDNTGAGASAHGIVVSASECSVVGGEVRGNGGNGIRIDSQTRTVISGVDAQGNTSTDIVEVGTANYSSIVACQAGGITKVGANTRLVGNPGIGDA